MAKEKRDSIHWNNIEVLDTFQIAGRGTVVTFDLRKFQGKEGRVTKEDLIIEVNDTLRYDGDEYVVKGIEYKDLGESGIEPLIALNIRQKYCK